MTGRLDRAAANLRLRRSEPASGPFKARKGRSWRARCRHHSDRLLAWPGGFRALRSPYQAPSPWRARWVRGSVGRHAACARAGQASGQITGRGVVGGSAIACCRVQFFFAGEGTPPSLATTPSAQTSGLKGLEPGRAAAVTKLKSVLWPVGKRPMPQARSPIVERIRSALHAQYDAILKEPLPERWVDLIDRLNEQERLQGKSQKPKRRCSPSRSS